MHLVLSCYNLLEDREVMLENILEFLDVNEYILFENQDPELQFLSLMGCVNGTSFENINVVNVFLQMNNEMHRAKNHL